MVGGIGGRLSNSIQAHCTLVYVTRRHRAIIATIISESRMNRGLSPPSPASLTHSFSPSCRVLQVGTHVPLSRGLGLVGCPQWRPRFSEPRPPSGGFGRVAPRPGSACWSLGREGKKTMLNQTRARSGGELQYEPTLVSFGSAVGYVT